MGFPERPAFPGFAALERGLKAAGSATTAGEVKPVLDLVLPSIPPDALGSVGINHSHAEPTPS